VLLADCDVHAPAPSLEVLAPHLDGYWRDYAREAGFRAPSSIQTVYPAGAPTTMRAGADGSLEDLAAHLTREGASVAIVNCFSGVEALRNVDFAGALASAVNDWVAAEWLARDERLRAAIVVKPDDPAGAAAEVARLAGDPRFVHVLLPVRAERPYGNRAYWPLLEAAVAHGRPLALHFGGSSGNPPTPVGWPSYYVEEYVGMAHVFAAQITSLIAEGAFERFPALRVVLLESGWSWLPPLMWRLDKEWRGLRREIPWVKRAPSETIRAQMRAAIQPIDGPREAAGLLRLLEQIGGEDFLMFSSDYPHGHARGYEEAFAGALPPELDRRIRYETAAEFYAL
jgi:predicted TIM-barrel fold metal-dependent hydrolase